MHALSILVVWEPSNFSIIRMSLKDPAEDCGEIEELSMAEKRSEELLRQRLGFLSTVSHEIRTPLNAIIGISDLLQQPTSKDQREEYLQILKQTSETLLELVNNVLDFSKIKSGKLKVTNKVFDLRNTITRSLYGEKVKARTKNLQLDVNIDPDLPEVIVGDSVKLGQVIMNLVSNAIKFTEQGTVRIDVKVEELLKDTVSLYFSICDTGIGIPEEQMENIFEAFNQGSEDINIRYAGTGLGLSISQGVISMLGGELKVKSAEGKGSEFSFRLKFPIATCTQNEVSEKSAVEIPNPQGTKLLLVEDNKINVIVAQKNLEKWGIDFDIALNGSEAIEMVKRNTYDLVLMDLQMPVMDGFSATRIIRDLPDEKFKSLPIIALTAASEQYYQEKVQLAGFNDFINKPFHAEELLRKITLYSRRSQASSPSVSL